MKKVILALVCVFSASGFSYEAKTHVMDGETVCLGNGKKLVLKKAKTPPRKKTIRK